MVIFNTAFMFKLFVNVFQSLLNGGSVYLHTILTVLYENIKKTYAILRESSILKRSEIQFPNVTLLLKAQQLQKFSI